MILVRYHCVVFHFESNPIGLHKRIRTESRQSVLALNGKSTRPGTQNKYPSIQKNVHKDRIIRSPLRIIATKLISNDIKRLPQRSWPCLET